MDNDKLVVIVDDYAPLREAVESLLASDGYTVVAFACAKELLRADDIDAIDCLVLDMDLPGMSGLDLQRWLATTDGPPVIFLTGCEDHDGRVRQSALDAGGLYFVRKPFEAEELLHAVRCAVSQPKTTRSTSWRELLADPGENGHIVQLYQDDNFYGEAISHFAAEGIARGESIILVATKPNWANISRRLEAKGSDTNELFRRGQLTLLDADATLPKFMAGNMPDAEIFKPLAKETIAKARAGGKYSRVRWWGEMVNVLYANGNLRGSNRLEELFDEVGREESVPVFCSFLMDKFDPKIYEEVFGNVCHTHSHVIPAHDYVRHRLVVNRAISEVIGEISVPLLQSFISWQGAPSLMPSSQALLLWVRDKMPEHFEPVLTRARQLELRASEGRRA